VILGNSMRFLTPRHASVELFRGSDGLRHAKTDLARDEPTRVVATLGRKCGCSGELSSPDFGNIDLFPNGDVITERVKGLCVEEMRRLEAGHESLEGLREVIDKHDALLREALEKNEKGKTHDNRATFGDGNRGLQQVADYGHQNNKFGRC
jgi:hypothetical protein